MFEKIAHRENQQPSSYVGIPNMEKVQRSSRKGVGSSDPKRRASRKMDDDMIFSCMRMQAAVKSGAWLTPMCENNVIEQTNIESQEWDNAKSDVAHFFGEDTVAEAIVCPEEVRGKIPGDYGRSRGIAWLTNTLNRVAECLFGAEPVFAV